MDISRIQLIASAVRRAIESISPEQLPWDSFPRGACGDASLILGQVFHDFGITGFEYICGNKYDANGDWSSSHAWLRYGKWIIDITADQFSDVETSVIISKDSTWHRNWEEETPRAATLLEYGDQVPNLWIFLSILKPRLEV